ncbi:MAG TPA: copper resistance CopC family protein [Pedococcus sp.]|nr:copper resistance CopC family protein [Pedococcus sp.]
MHRPTIHRSRRVGSLLRATASVGVLVALGAASALSAPTAAQAHAVLLRTSPARGATVPKGPTEVTLTFDEPPLQLGATVRVTGPSGVVTSGSARIEQNTVHQAIAPNLPGGAYRVDWKVTSDDGHPVSDTFGFTVTTAATSSGASSSPTPTSPAASPTATSASPSSPSSSSVLPWGLAALAVAVVAVVGFAASRRRGGAKA